MCVNSGAASRHPALLSGVARRLSPLASFLPDLENIPAAPRQYASDIDISNVPSAETEKRGRVARPTTDTRHMSSHTSVAIVTGSPRV